MQLDDKTLSAVALLTSLLLPLVLLAIGQLTTHSQATRAWTRGVGLYSLGFLFIALRNVIPDWVSIVVANCLFVVGYGELLHGVKYFFNRPVSRRWLAYILPPFTVLFFIFLGGPGSLETRQVISSIVMGCLSAAIAREFYLAAARLTQTDHLSNAAERRLILIFCGVFAVSAVILASRGVIIFAPKWGMGGVDNLKLAVSISYVTGIFINFMLASCLPLLVSRRIQRDLYASQASLLKAEELGGLGTLVVNLQTKEMTTNSVLNRMLGLDAGQSLSKEVWQDMLHPDDRPRAIQALDAITNGITQSSTSEYRIVRPDNGHTRWLTVSSQVAIDAISNAPSLMSSMRDVTELKESELAALQARELADQASSAKSNFLANMSHEIRTPMNAILGLLNLLQTTELTARQRDYASKTEGAAQSLLGLLNDILDFSKVEAGKMTLESEPFALEQMLRNLAVVLSANVGTRDIEVLFDVDPSLPPLLRGDAMRLQQVLINLGGNAIKFTTHGQVVLALRKRGETADAVSIEFAVQDTGIGIAPQHQQHIFSGFSQAEGSTTRRFGGTGLGLAISQRFVNMMGGNIALVSTEGVGSIFTFVLSLPVVAHGPEPIVAPEQVPLEPQRALIVDDNPIAGPLLLRMVQSWGLDAELATSGAEALDRVARQSAHVSQQRAFSTVFIDWYMPQMDGWEISRRIVQFAAQHQLASPTVVMLTAHGRDELAQRTDIEQSMVGALVSKPFTEGMLRDAVAQARDGNSGLRKPSEGRRSLRQLQGMRILVVEDNLINQQVAEELLGNAGAIVSLASNGQLGVDAVASAAPQFDAVLMDIQMPVLDGYGATQLIRHELGLSKLPIIAMTANAMESDRVACLAAGMNEHIGKPFNMGKLVSLLIRLTGIQPEKDPQEVRTLVSDDVVSLPEVPGLDLATAVGRMSGMRALYLRTARDFSRVLDTTITDLRRHFAAGEQQPALMRLHTLKGNAGTLGAMDLAAKSAALEILCKTPGGLIACDAQLNELATLITSTQQSLAQAIAQLTPGVPVTKVSSDQVVNAPQAITALRQFQDLAAAQDMELLQRFAELRGHVEPLPDGFCDQLDTALQNLDLEAAQTLCTAMLARLGKQHQISI